MIQTTINLLKNLLPKTLQGGMLAAANVTILIMGIALYSFSYRLDQTKKVMLEKEIQIQQLQQQLKVNEEYTKAQVFTARQEGIKQRLQEQLKDHNETHIIDDTIGVHTITIH